jgi:hypothetical protein
VEQRRERLRAAAFRVVVNPTQRGPLFHEEDVLVEMREA